MANSLLKKAQELGIEPAGRSKSLTEKAGILGMKPARQIQPAITGEKEKSGLFGYFDPVPDKVRTRDVVREAALGLTKAERGFGESIAGAVIPFTKSFKGLEESRQGLTEMQDKTLQRIQQNRAMGRDNTRLLGALQESDPGIRDESINPALNKSNKQVVGEALGVATDIAAFGKFGGSATAPTSFLGGFAKGAARSAPFGAAFGASEALQEDKSNREVIESSIRGGVLAAALGGTLEGLLGASRSSKRAAKLKEEAVAQYKRGLQVTKEKYKESADKAIPDLLNERVWGTRKSLVKKAERGMDFSKEEYQKLGELRGVSNIRGIVDDIQKQMKDLTINGKVPSSNVSKYRALQSLKEDVISLRVMDSVDDPRAVQQNLRKLAESYGDLLYESRKSQKTISDSSTLSQMKKVDAAIRELLSTDRPDYAKINKVYNMSSRLYDILQETTRRQSSQDPYLRLTSGVFGTMGGILGVGAGGASGGIIGAVALGSLALIRRATWWNTLRAVQKARLADKILQQSPQAMFKSIIVLERLGAKALTQFGIIDQSTEKTNQE